MDGFKSKFFCMASCAATVLILSACELGSHSQAGEKSQTDPLSGQEHLKPATIDKNTSMAMEEEIYVPIYSNIYVENERRSAELTATLSFRNIDPEHAIILKSVRYYSTDGKLLKEYLTRPVTLDPLATADFVIARQDASGGAGANFLVDWVAQTNVIEPLAEAVMVGTGSPQSMSFVSRGIVIKKMLTPQKTQHKKGDTTHAT
jgi:hypothetical protein